MGTENGPAEDPAGPQWVMWTCPICGTSEGQLIEGDVSATRAVSDLLGHIKMTNDDQHGPVRQLPDRGAFEPEDCIEVTEYQLD